MFCSECGTRLPDNAQFCSGCGASTTSAAAPVGQNTNASATQQNAAAKKPRKKKANFLVIGIVLLVFYLIGKGVGNSMADSFVSSGETGTAAGQNSTNQSTSSSSAAYDKVFSDRSIVFVPEIFFGLDYDAYVHVDDEGIVTHMQYGSKDDIVTEYAITVYYPAEIVDMQAQDEYIRSLYGNTGLPFVSLSTNMGHIFYSYTLSISNLNDLANLQMVEEAGLIRMEEDNALWSMSATEESLLAQGYIKK